MTQKINFEQILHCLVSIFVNRIICFDLSKYGKCYRFRSMTKQLLKYYSDNRNQIWLFI